MPSLLDLLRQGDPLSPSQLADILQLSEDEVHQQLRQLQEEGRLLGYRPILHPDAEEANQVRAVIEVKIAPEREGGFDRLALRISRFDEVESCYLMSGGYDLLVFVTGSSLREVATFVSERLATIGGVMATATHFLLRPYKEKGFLLIQNEDPADRPAVSP